MTETQTVAAAVSEHTGGALSTALTVTATLAALIALGLFAGWAVWAIWPSVI